MELDPLFTRLWHDYVAVTPQAERIRALLDARGETVVNDHVALRTFSAPGVDIDALARVFVDRGYRPAGTYEFPDKGLTARHYEHPHPDAPKVFISQLELDRFSPELRAQVQRFLAHLTDAQRTGWDFCSCGRPWPMTHATYEALRAESEYAAWVAAYGYRANHFTVDVGRLQTFADIHQLNQFLLDHGFALNDRGGLVKGSPAVHLEQSSTRAEAVPVTFTDGTFEIPSCYYEFARRYPLPNGQLFQGFVPTSATRLFESTDHRPD